MKHNLFFVAHDHPEGGQEDGSSKFNAWEAEFAIQLARHFVQGYEHGEVRTPYWAVCCYSLAALHYVNIHRMCCLEKPWWTSAGSIMN
jgi:hypothetical protein